MLAAGGLQLLLQHLHQLLLPIITPAPPPLLHPAPGPSGSGGQAAASSGDADSKGSLAVAPEDLDTLLAVLEAIASADAAVDSSANAQVLSCTYWVHFSASRHAYQGASLFDLTECFCLSCCSAWLCPNHHCCSGLPTTVSSSACSQPYILCLYAWALCMHHCGPLLSK